MLTMPFLEADFPHVEHALVADGPGLDSCAGSTSWTCGEPRIDDDAVVRGRARPSRAHQAGAGLCS